MTMDAAGPPNIAHWLGVDAAGPADAPPIVFLHGASYTRKAWGMQLQALADEFRVYALDLPGHGSCSHTEYDWDDSLEYVQRFLRDIAGRPALLVGVSLGGCLGVTIAGGDSDLLAGLIVSGSTFDARGHVCYLVLRGEAWTFRHREAQLTRRFQRWVRGRLPSEFAESIVAAGCHWESAARAVISLTGRDFVAALGRYDGPALILNGDRDWVHRSAEGVFVRAAQNARAATVPGGHIANLDAPEAFTAKVREFAREIFEHSPKDKVSHVR
ncbi:carboxylesterase [Capsulimonas corticalis]|uniref:Carboxylesterase n=1 Tax=Capsulimonas corticalis TaxID=2219043 RepID=A0A9N7Q8W9_9BACT|nr:alpha/beta hydrolase [Capsulimonas corticalis]BDI28625.1 carboxylesterase [Capsulimonas corticalis]